MLNPNDDPIELGVTTLNASHWRERAARLEAGIRDLWETWMDDDATWVEVAGKIDDLHASLDEPHGG